MQWNHSHPCDYSDRNLGFYTNKLRHQHRPPSRLKLFNWTIAYKYLIKASVLPSTVFITVLQSNCPMSSPAKYQQSHEKEQEVCRLKVNKDKANLSMVDRWLWLKLFKWIIASNYLIKASVLSSTTFITVLKSNCPTSFPAKYQQSHKKEQEVCRLESKLGQGQSFDCWWVILIVVEMKTWTWLWKVMVEDVCPFIIMM